MALKGNILIYTMDAQLAECRRQKHVEYERLYHLEKIRDKYADLICLDRFRLAAARIVRWIKRRPSRTLFYINITQEEVNRIPGRYFYRTIRNGNLLGFDLRTIRDYAYLFDDAEWAHIQRQCRLIDPSTKRGNDFRIMLELSKSLATDIGKQMRN